MKDYTTICHSAPSEILAIIALENASEIARSNLALVEKNLELARDFFSRYKDKLTWFEPLAGSIAYPALEMDMDVFDFCEGSVREKNVMVVPSRSLLDESQHFRIGFGRRNFPEALSVFEDYVRGI